jgi:hypothetical protein
MERNGRRKMQISCRAERQGSHETFARGQRRVSFVLSQQHTRHLEMLKSRRGMEYRFRLRR